MKYKDLIEIGFERFNMGDGFDLVGFHDFYLFLKVSREVTFEWHWKNRNIVKMVRYDGTDVKNYVEIIDMETLKSLIYLYKEDDGNAGNKPKIGKTTKNTYTYAS